MLTPLFRGGGPGEQRVNVNTFDSGRTALAAGG